MKKSARVFIILIVGICIGIAMLQIYLNKDLFSFAAAPKPVVPKPVVPKPVAPKPVVPKPVVPKPVVPKPNAPKQVTPKPVPKPVTPKPVTPKPVTPKPVTPKPITVTKPPTKFVPPPNPELDAAMAKCKNAVDIFQCMENTLFPPPIPYIPPELI